MPDNGLKKSNTFGNNEQGFTENRSTTDLTYHQHHHWLSFSCRRTAAKTHFSQCTINAVRFSSEFKAWNASFDDLIKKILRQVSPRDIRLLLEAGAEERLLLSLLAFVVYDYDERLSLMTLRRKQMSSLSAQLFTAPLSLEKTPADTYLDVSALPARSYSRNSEAIG